MNTKLMQDQQIRRYFIFLLSLSFFMLFISMLFCRIVTHDAKFMLLHHDESIAASLTAQGISEEVAARALTDTDVILEEEKMRSGREILAKTGIRPALETQLLPPLEDFQKKTGVCRRQRKALSIRCSPLWTGSRQCFRRRMTQSGRQRFF